MKVLAPPTRFWLLLPVAGSFLTLKTAENPPTRLTGEQTHVGLTRLERTSGLTHQLLPDLLQRHHLEGGAEGQRRSGGPSIKVFNPPCNSCRWG